MRHLFVKSHCLQKLAEESSIINKVFKILFLHSHFSRYTQRNFPAGLLGTMGVGKQQFQVRLKATCHFWTISH
jgi:hypothetical protein